MNSYAIDLSAGGLGFNRANRAALRKAIGYAVLWGGNSVCFNPNFRTLVRVDDTYGVPYNPELASDVRLPSVLTFDLDFSLSNIQNFFDVPLAGINTVVATQTVYDTANQAVREYVDKPYAVKGYTAIVTVIDGDDPTADFDGFVSFPFTALNTTEDVVRGTVYIGTVNSSATDFYTPFDRNENEVTFIDPKATDVAIGRSKSGVSAFNRV